MTHLEFVTLLYPDHLDVIGSMCRSLKEVTFGQNASKSRVDEHFMVNTKNTSPENLESILMKWPKVFLFCIINIFTYF